MILQTKNRYFNSVNIDTVRGQFVYELQGCYYYNPDVIADFTNVFIEQVESNRVRVGGAKGKEPFN
jgi:hypothetical protein